MDLLPQWLALFRSSPAPGSFSFLSSNASAGATLYGSADVAHVVATTQCLNLTSSERAGWAAQLNVFQNHSSGYFAIQPWEQAGLQPWHAGAYATSALALLGAQPAAPLQWAIDVAEGGEAAWSAIFPALLNATTPACNSIWCMAHEIASYPAALLMTRGAARDGAFFAWWSRTFLAPAVDPATAMWCDRRAWAPPNVACLGGAFHMNFVLVALGEPLLLPATLARVAAALQNESTGLWGGDVDPGYISLDGVYQVTRPTAQMGPPSDAARIVCTRFLAAAAASLNDATRVLGNAYGTNSHALPGAVTAIAECAKWFPDLVKTVRPWVQTLDVAPFV